MSINFKFIFSVIVVFFLFINSCKAAKRMNDLKELQDIKLKIIQVGDPVLRNGARPLTKEEIGSPPIQQLIVLLKNTMRDSPGVGLAAPQVGIPLQIVVIEDREEYLKLLKPEEIKERDRRPIPFHVIINPKITLLESEKQADFYEGCLSLNGFVGKVPRALKVKVEALNEKGEPINIQAQGWYARILQHEIDHLKGTLYIDRMHTRTFTTVENYKKFQS
jgi:peptide deformylase